MKRKVLSKVGKTTNNSDFDVLPMLPMFPSGVNRLLRKEMVSTLYEYYLTSDVGEPDEYIDLCDALRSAGEQDQFVIRINSGGGLLSSANMIINAINETQAHVHGVIESTAASAATMIFLACHSYSLGEEADMMIHTSSSMYCGKEHEQFSYVMHGRKKIHRMMKERYEGFLTEVELLRILDGVDMWFDREEIEERLENFTEFQQKKFEAELEAFQKEREDTLDGVYTKPKKKKILPS